MKGGTTDENYYFSSTDNETGSRFFTISGTSPISEEESNNPRLDENIKF
jgi:hypothetical protein